MKKHCKFLTIFLIVVLSACCLVTGVGCGSQTFSGIAKSVELPESVPSVEDGEIELTRFIQATKHNNDVMDGLIESPYYEVTFNGVNEVFSYATPLYCSSSLFSFGYIEATEDMFPLTITITAKGDKDSLTYAKVIPEKLGVKTTVAGGKVSFTINSFDYYTVLFDEDPDKEFVDTYTLMVREYEELEVPSGYNLIEYGPGIHYVDRIKTNADGIDGNTMIYLHSGAYLVCNQPDLYTEKSWIDVHGYRDWAPFIKASGVSNIIIKGHGVIDMSNLTLHARTPVHLTSCKNVLVEGITIINSQSFTIHIQDCVGVEVRDVILLGYRVNSDGIVPINSRDVLIENCFVKSGDDLCEVKASSGTAPTSQTGGSNITYRHCQAWAEKTRCFGFIQETEMDVDGILYEDCSALYQDAKWDDAMGAFLVCVGDHSTVQNVKFVNCDAYHVNGYVINLCLGDNQWTTNTTDGCRGEIHNVTFENFNFYSKYLERANAENGQLTAIQLKNKKTVVESNAADFTGIVFTNIVMDGNKMNKELFDLYTYYNGAVDGNNINQVKFN